MSICQHMLLFLLTDDDKGTPDTAPADPPMQPPLIFASVGGGDATQSSNINFEEIQCQNATFVESKRAKSTIKKQKATVNRFMDWARGKGEMRQLRDVPPEQLDQLLAVWFVDLKQANGKDYEPNSLDSYLSAVKGHLAELGHDDEFKIASKVVSAKKLELKSRGLGNTSDRASRLPPDDEEQMWATGALGDSDPEALIHTMWFLMTKCYGFRGCHESRQLEWGDVSLKFNGDNSPHLQWNERLTKTRVGTGNLRAFAPKMFQNTKHPEHCPVRLYEPFRSRRPVNGKCSAFFLGMNSNRPTPSAAWFVDAPMGKNRLAQIMSRIAHRAGLQHGKFTNHSVRCTMCTQLYQQDVDPSLITQLSGHKNPNGLAPYTVASDYQQKDMCHRLQNPKTRHVAVIMPSHGITNNLALPSTSSATAGSGKPPAILGQHVDANQVTVAPGSAMPDPKSSQPRQQFMLNEARGLTGFPSNAVLNGPITININMLSSNSTSSVTSA